MIQDIPVCVCARARVRARVRACVRVVYNYCHIISKCNIYTKRTPQRLRPSLRFARAPVRLTSWTTRLTIRLFS